MPRYLPCRVQPRRIGQVDWPLPPTLQDKRSALATARTPARCFNVSLARRVARHGQKARNLPQRNLLRPAYRLSCRPWRGGRRRWRSHLHGNSDRNLVFGRSAVETAVLLHENAVAQQGGIGNRAERGSLSCPPHPRKVVAFESTFSRRIQPVSGGTSLEFLRMRKLSRLIRLFPDESVRARPP
jgi:hypothetical protein